MYAPYMLKKNIEKKGLAGNLLNKVVDDMRNKGVTPLYLVTDQIGFYERYGWEFFYVWFKVMMNPK